MKVIVDTQSGPSFSIGVDFWDTVLTIKKKIEKSQRIPVFKQTLFFQVMVLQDHLHTFVCQFLHNSRLFLFISPDNNTNQNNNDQVPQTEQYPSAPSNPIHDEFVNNQDLPVMSKNDQVLETEESPTALMKEFFRIQDSPEGKDNQVLHQTKQSPLPLNSFELALKNSQRNENVLSVDDLLDFSNEDDDVFVEDESELKVQRKRGVSDENTLHRSNEKVCRNAGQTQTQTRRCSHCGVQKTPQWRAGPSGAKTLCNACGLRYNSGRLLAKYRRRR